MPLNNSQRSANKQGLKKVKVVESRAASRPVEICSEWWTCCRNSMDGKTQPAERRAKGSPVCANTFAYLFDSLANFKRIKPHHTGAVCFVW